MASFKKSEGFTIIELLVTVAIIVILTGIIVSNFAASRSRSRDAKRVSDLGQMQLAFELFFDRCNQYPILDGIKTADNPNTIPLTTNNGCPAGINLGTFIGVIPTAPTPGSAYVYAINNATGPTDYVIQTTLENNNQVLTDAPAGVLMSVVRCYHNELSYCVQPR